MKDKYDFPNMKRKNNSKLPIKTGNVDIPEELFQIKPVIKRTKKGTEFVFYINPIQRAFARLLNYLKGLFK